MRTLQFISHQLRQHDDGQDLIEYALLVGPVSLVCIVALTAAGSQVNVIFDSIKTKLTNAAAAGS